MNHWFRAYHGAPMDPKWLTIAKRAGTSPVVVTGVWWALLDYASQADDRGSLDGIDLESMAEFMGIAESLLVSIRDAMRSKGLIEGDRIAKWEKRQPAREDDGAAERQRRHRAKPAPEVVAPEAHESCVTEGDGENVTHCHAASHSVTRINTEERRGDEIRDNYTSSPSARARDDATEHYPKVAEAIPPDPDGSDPLAKLLITVPSARSYLAAMAEALAGDGGFPAVTPAELRTAVTDWLANAERPNLRLFRGYLRGAKPKPPNGNGAGAARASPQKLTLGERVFLRAQASQNGSRNATHPQPPHALRPIPPPETSHD